MFTFENIRGLLALIAAPRSPQTLWPISLIWHWSSIKLKSSKIINCWQRLIDYVYGPDGQGSLFAYIRTWKPRLDTLFNLVISSFHHNMFYLAWTTPLIYHDRPNNVVQVCSFIKPWKVCSNMHFQACQQHSSSSPDQPCIVQACQQAKISSVHFLLPM